MQWYYAINGQRLGPISQAEFEQLARDGRIKADTLVWRQGMANWQPYAAIAGGPPPMNVVASGTEVQPGAGDDSEVCVVSGKRYPRREMIQYEGKWVSAEHRDEFFQRLREGVSVPGVAMGPGSFQYGGFWLRWVAIFIDGLILGVIGIFVNMLLAMAVFGSPNYFGNVQVGAGTPKFFLFQGIALTSGFFLGLVFSWFFVSRYQATPGKMALGLKIVRADGSRLSNGRIIGRYAAQRLSGLPTLLIGYIMAGFDDEKRALHDRICDTRVIKVK